MEEEPRRPSPRILLTRTPSPTPHPHPRRAPTGGSGSSSAAPPAAPWAKLMDFEDPPPGYAAGLSGRDDGADEAWDPKGDAQAHGEETEGMWDAGMMREALTTPEALVDVFNLPRTPDTLAAAARVTEALKAEAHSRVAVCHPASVDVIVARLEAFAAKPAEGSGAARPSREHRSFAAGMLKAVLAAPPRARQATHALVSRAAALPLHAALSAEFRVMARALTGAGAPDAAGWRLNDPAAPPLTPAELEALLAPLPGTDGLAELAFPRRKLAAQVEKQRKDATEAWAKQYEAALEDGTADGA